MEPSDAHVPDPALHDDPLDESQADVALGSCRSTRETARSARSDATATRASLDRLVVTRARGAVGGHLKLPAGGQRVSDHDNDGMKCR